MEETFEMSEREIDRYHLLKQVINRVITQKTAGELLGVSDRQIRNLLAKVKAKGPTGLISKRRGKPSNNRKKEGFMEACLSIIRDQLEGFGPTLAKEKLEELYGMIISVETLRKWMIKSNLWISRKKKKRSYLPRQRRSCFGELIQIDGSHHHWFGEDRDAVNLTVFVDDATGKLTSLYFSREETLNSYFEALEIHLKNYGRPRAFYSDRYAVFQAQGGKTGNKTQMHKALDKLEIELILANSPQAKGRVERANRTLQDRLLKELRLKKIKTIEEANTFCKEFIEVYNKKFSKKPMSIFDAHRSLMELDTERILCRYATRTILSDCIFQFNNRFYQVQEINARRSKGRKIEVRETRKGKLRVFLYNKELKIKALDAIIDTPQILNRKQVLNWTPKNKKTPSKDHPWRKYGSQNIRKSWKDEQEVI